MLPETHSDNLASLLSKRSEALCPKSLLELAWMADQPCEHVSKLEAGKSIRFLFVALQKRFSGLRTCRWVSSFSTVFIVLWQL